MKIENTPVIHVYCSIIHNSQYMWKQHKCPSADKLIKKMWYIYSYKVILLSHEKEGNPAICNMGNPWVCDVMWGKLEKGR